MKFTGNARIDPSKVHAARVSRTLYLPVSVRHELEGSVENRRVEKRMAEGKARERPGLEKDG